MSKPCFKIEDSLGAPVCGIDEVGRGPLAGPVVAAAVIFKPNARKRKDIYQIDDSKKLTAAKRQVFCTLIRETAFVGIGRAEVEEIDHHNIYQATFIAMQRAFDNLCADCDIPPAVALIDGNKAPVLSCVTKPVVKGDQLSLSIAAASIIAKEYRDGLMQDLALTHPHYGWQTNAGYSTKEHMQALKIHGATPHHRKTFKPVYEVLSINY